MDPESRIMDLVPPRLHRIQTQSQPLARSGGHIEFVVAP